MSNGLGPAHVNGMMDANSTYVIILTIGVTYSLPARSACCLLNLAALQLLILLGDQGVVYIGVTAVRSLLTLRKLRTVDVHVGRSNL